MLSLIRYAPGRYSLDQALVAEVEAVIDISIGVVAALWREMHSASLPN